MIFLKLQKGGKVEELSLLQLTWCCGLDFAVCSLGVSKKLRVDEAGKTDLNSPK